MLAFSHNPLEHVIQKTIFRIDGGSPFTSFTLLSNHIFMQIVAAVLIALLIPWALRRRSAQDAAGHNVQTGFFGNAFEWLCLWLRENVARPALGAYTDQFVGYIWTVFFFILACNLVGLLPLDPFNKYLFGPKVSLLGGAATGNVWVTAALALCTMVMIIYHGAKEHGTAYFAHFFSVGPWPFSWIFFGPLEIVGFFVRIGALTIRLFANMLAGHILLAVLIGFMMAMSGLMSEVSVTGKVGSGVVMVIILVGSIAISAMEMVLVAPLQALIFTILTAVFIGQAVNMHSHEDHGHEAEELMHDDVPHAMAHAG